MIERERERDLQVLVEEEEIHEKVLGVKRRVKEEEGWGLGVEKACSLLGSWAG